MKKPPSYKLGDTAYIVRHCPFQPTGKDDGERQWADMACSREVRDVFTSLTVAVRFARAAAKLDFWGLVEIYEAKLENPYPDEIPDALLKPSARSWERIDGGYKCEIERG